MSGSLWSHVRGFSGATLVDALGRLVGHKAHILDLVSPTPGRRLFGRAATIRFVPWRSDIFDEAIHSFSRCFYAAVTLPCEDTVLVLDSAAQHDVSMGGGTKFSRVHNHHLAGLITDGRLRDFDELARYDPVFYCSGETVRAGTAAVMPLAANVTVSLCGTTVAPGDYVYADDAAVVVIPARHITQVLKLARDIQGQDRAFLETIRDEDSEIVREQGSRER